jgi:hypothetical protein
MEITIGENDKGRFAWSLSSTEYEISLPSMFEDQNRVWDRSRFPP